MRSEITFRECDIGAVEEPRALLLEILSELGQAQEDLYKMLGLLEHGSSEGPGREVSVLNLRGRQPGRQGER